MDGVSGCSSMRVLNVALSAAACILGMSAWCSSSMAARESKLCVAVPVNQLALADVRSILGKACSLTINREV